MSYEIRKLDKYNFTLGKRLSEQKHTEAFGTTLVQTHINIPVYYGRLSGALYGYCKHNNIQGYNVDSFKSYDSIKPTDDEAIPFIETVLNL